MDEKDDIHAGFRDAVAGSRLQDPLPTFERLARATGTQVDDVIHHALVRWVSAGSEAILTLTPPVLHDLVEARRREDWAAVGGMIDWLAAGL